MSDYTDSTHDISTPSQNEHIESSNESDSASHVISDSNEDSYDMYEGDSDDYAYVADMIDDQISEALENEQYSIDSEFEYNTENSDENTTEQEESTSVNETNEIHQEEDNEINLDEGYSRLNQEVITSHDYINRFNESEEQTHLTHTIASTNESSYSPTHIRNKACIIPLYDIIPFPGQRIPYVTSNPSIVLLLLQILGLRSSSEESQLVPCLIGLHFNDTYTSYEERVQLTYGCTVTVEKAHFDESSYCIGVVFICKKRCCVQSFDVSMTNVITGDIEILDDGKDKPHSILPLSLQTSTNIPINLYPLLGKSVFIPHYTELNETQIENTALRILISCNQYYNCMTDDEILRALPTSTIQLSYLLANQLLVNYDEQKQLFLAESAEDRIQLANTLCKDSIVVRCKCSKKLLHFLAYQRLNLFGGNCVRSVFVNRFGNSFSVITSKTLMNYVTASPPSAEDTWFPGYKWEILQCARCGSHIGWRFSTDEDLSPKVFFAISQTFVYYSTSFYVCCNK